MNLIRNSIWNVLGFAIPVISAIPVMGYLARVLGTEIFGIFTLCYSIVGYASLFDMGLSRAVVRAIAINANSSENVKKIIGTATGFVTILSIVASALLYFSSAWLVDILSISANSASDARTALQYLSFAVPAFLLGTIWFSYLEGLGKFYKLNVLKCISGLCVALAPLLAVLHEASLTSAVIGLTAGRFASMLIAYFWGLWGGNKWHLLNIDYKILHQLLSFGGWLTASNIISPMMVYFDRFLLANFSGAKSVAYYTIPAEAVSKLLIFPMAVGKVIFPSLSAKENNAEKETKLSYQVVLATCIPLTIAISTFSSELLELWVGKEYAENSTSTLIVLMIGFLFNSLAQIPYARIQAAGHSKITAIIHIFEIIPYAIILYFLVVDFSYFGAALAWTIRVTLDLILLEIYAKKLNKKC